MTILTPWVRLKKSAINGIARVRASKRNKKLAEGGSLWKQELERLSPQYASFRAVKRRWSAQQPKFVVGMSLITILIMVWVTLGRMDALSQEINPNVVGIYLSLAVSLMQGWLAFSISQQWRVQSTWHPEKRMTKIIDHLTRFFRQGGTINQVFGWFLMMFTMVCSMVWILIKCNSPEWRAFYNLLPSSYQLGLVGFSVGCISLVLCLFTTEIIREIFFQCGDYVTDFLMSIEASATEPGSIYYAAMRVYQEKEALQISVPLADRLHKDNSDKSSRSMEGAKRL